MFVAFVFMAFHVTAAPNEMETIEQNLEKCSRVSPYPTVKACSAQAKRDAYAALDQHTRKFAREMRKRGATHPHLLEVAGELEEAQRNWLPYHAAQCRYLLKFNKIEAVDMEWRMDNCEYVAAKKRYEEIINVFMK